MKIGMLPTREMLAHSNVWLNDPRIRNELAADPIGRVLLEKIGEVHGTLSESQTRRLVTEKRIADMTALLGVLDARHVDLARAIYFAITAAGHASKDPDEARALRAVRDALFPGGLSVINASYMGRSGAAVEIKTHVTAVMRAHLRMITLGGSDLAELLDEWLDTAERIGRLAHERSSLVASISKSGSDAAKVDRVAARRAWLQVSRGLLSNLPFMNLPDKIREEIEASLTRSVRGAKRRNQRDPEPTPEPDTRATDDPGAIAVNVANTATAADAAKAGDASITPRHLITAKLIAPTALQRVSGLPGQSDTPVPGQSGTVRRVGHTLRPVTRYSRSGHAGGFGEGAGGASGG